MRTSLYTVLCIVIRLGAVMLAIETIVALPAAWSFLSSNEMGPGVGAAVVGSGVATFALATLLWVYPGVLARIAAAGSSQQVFESPVSGAELQQITLCVMGVWFVVGGVGELAGLVIRVVAWRAGGQLGLRDAMLRDLGHIVALLLKIGLGLALALGARVLTAMLQRARYGAAARDATADEPDSPSHEATR